jgi:hypothetical protein
VNAGTTPAWGKYYLPDTLGWLAELCDDRGQAEEGEKWRAEEASARTATQDAKR